MGDSRWEVWMRNNPLQAAVLSNALTNPNHPIHALAQHALTNLGITPQGGSDSWGGALIDYIEATHANPEAGLTDLGRHLDVGGALDPGPQFHVPLPHPVPETLSQRQILATQVGNAVGGLLSYPVDHPVRKSANDSSKDQFWAGVLAKINARPYENLNATQSATAFADSLDESISADKFATDLHRWSGGRLNRNELRAARDLVNEVRAGKATYRDSQEVASRLNTRDAEREENDARAVKAASDRWSPEERAANEYRTAKLAAHAEDQKDSWRVHLEQAWDAAAEANPKPESEKVLVDTYDKAALAGAAGLGENDVTFTGQADRQAVEQSRKESSGESGW